ncbi:MAG: hypothetical protein SGCHY_001238 [Lobulomycetales sp.]
MAELSDLRQSIDAVDKKLVSLLNERANIAVSIGLAKRDASHVHLPAREAAVYDKIAALNSGPLSRASLQSIYREIMSASKALQRDISVAYLGPPGSYTHQAAMSMFGRDSAGPRSTADATAPGGLTYTPQDCIKSVFTALAGGTTYAVVPFENSAFGSVQETLDALVCLPENVFIRSTIVLPITHCLAVSAAGASMSFEDVISSITRVYSHTQAFGQCSKFLESTFPSSKPPERVPTTSTSQAAHIVASLPISSASICSPAAVDLYGLHCVKRGCQDTTENCTRFLLLGKETWGDRFKGGNKTLIRFTLDHREPGSLCDALEIIKKHGINLGKIDTRPSGQGLWHYVFFLEMQGHADDANVRAALEELRVCCLGVRVLGSYPSGEEEVVSPA